MKDSDNVARLEKLKPRYEKLRDLKIRTSAELERAEKDLEAAKEQAREIAGTDNEDEIRQQVLQNYEVNTKKVDDFLALIEEIDKNVNATENQ